MVRTNLRRHRFRTAPQYELLSFDRLSEDEQRALAALQRDPEFYGVLHSRTDASPTAKSVSKDTARLLTALRDVRPLPSFAAEESAEHCDVALAQMVLDEILEIEVNAEFICGPAALDEVIERRVRIGPQTAIATLSLEGLAYAEALPIDDALVLSERLYAFNRIPASMRWRRVLPDATAVEEYLGIGTGPTAGFLEAHWDRVRTRDDAWMAWSRRGPSQFTHPSYKLYVSPSCAALPFAFCATVNGLSESACVHWKVGSSVLDLVRPDKIVAYFETFELLQEAAATLGSALSGCEAHGVPFTAQIGESGLLSWGIDPMPDALSWQHPESWRIRICRCLGAALALAKRRTGPAAPAQFARERLRLEGIDPDTWVCDA